MTSVLRRLSSANESSLTDFQNELTSYMRVAKACVKQIFLKWDYVQDLDAHIVKVQHVADSAGFSSLIPCTFELESSDLSGNLEIFGACIHTLAALHKICKQIWRLAKIDGGSKEASLTDLETNISYLNANASIDSGLTNFVYWSSLFTNGVTGRREAAVLASDLISAVFQDFQDKLRIGFEEPDVHYKILLSDYYPLPHGHFIRGH